LLLEPIMKVEVIAPEEFMGEVIGDFNARKGKIEQLLPKGPVQVLSGTVPLSEIFGYSTALRSATQGRGTFTVQFDHFGPVERRSGT
jgi:elongation factor G